MHIIITIIRHHPCGVHFSPISPNPLHLLLLPTRTILTLPNLVAYS